MTWLLTWTTYGTRLPGDRRGFVSGVRTETGEKVIHNQPETPVDSDISGLRRYAESIMTQPAVWLTIEQAASAEKQFRETAVHRSWDLLALAVMVNHVHLVVAVADTVATGKLLTDFKAYTTRRLDREFNSGAKRKWWTERGSTRAPDRRRGRSRNQVRGESARAACGLAGERRGVSPPVRHSASSRCESVCRSTGGLTPRRSPEA